MIYTYKCKKCLHKFTLQLKVSEMNKPTETPCKCGGEIFKVIDAPTFILKGKDRSKSDVSKKLDGMK